MSDRPLALVTGASRGIGAAVADALAPRYEVLLGGRDLDALAKQADSIPGTRPWPAELTDPEALAAATATIDELDVLVHSAGIAELGSVADAPRGSWRRTFEVNVFAVAELTRLLLPALRARQGHVILINSGSGFRASPNWGAYAASKFALRAYGDVLRAEEPSLRVTSVYPGRTATDMQRAIRHTEGDAYEPEQYLRPKSVAAAVLAAVSATPDAQLTEISVRPTGWC